MTLSPNIKLLTQRYVEEGHPVPVLAQLFNTKPSVIRGRLKIWGLKAVRVPSAADRVLTLYAEGKTTAEISEEVGVSNVYVGAILREKNQKPIRSKTVPTVSLQERNVAICKMYLEGHTLVEVGYAFNLTRERIRQILVIHNVEERRTSQREMRRECRKQSRQIMPLYLQGLTRVEAVKSLGLQHSLLAYLPPPTKVQHRVHRVARFWRGVKKNTEPHPELGTPCWIWQQSKNPVTGYGSYNVGRKNISAHRYAYTIVKGKPKNWVLHRCDEPLCVNPDHLYDGTGVENARDRDKNGHRGRYSTGLNFEKAQQIRAELANGGDLRQIAKREGVSATTIYNIQQNRTYTGKDIPRITDDQILAVWRLRGQKNVLETRQETGVGINSIHNIWRGKKGGDITGANT